MKKAPARKKATPQNDVAVEHTEKDFAAFPFTRQDWDFSQVPEDELLLCRFYEYARELKVWHEIARCSRLLLEDARIDLRDSAYKAGGPGGGFVKTNWIITQVFTLFPEFPQMPWLSIDGQERRHRIEQLGTSDYPLPLEEFPQVAITEGGTNITRSVFGEVFHGTDAHFVVCWNYTDAQIAAEFRHWLIKTRYIPEPKKHKGRVSTQHDVLRAHLRELAAFRLLQRFTLPLAKREVENALGGASEARLYTTDRSWFRAKRNAKTFLSEFHHEAGSIFVLLGIMARQ